MNGEFYNGFFIRKIDNWVTLVYAAYRVTGAMEIDESPLQIGEFVGQCQNVRQAKRQIDNDTLCPSYERPTR